MKRKNIKDKLKEYFLVNPSKKLRVRGIERELKLPLPSVIKYSKELEEEGILKKQKIENIALYAADRSSNKFLLEKKLFNIKSVYNSGLVEFLKEELSNPTIVLFGSYSKGEDIENSDIDIYIETLSKKQVNLEKYERILNRKIQMLIHNDLKEIKNHNLMNNVINGVVLNGFLEVFK